MKQVWLGYFNISNGRLGGVRYSSRDREKEDRDDLPFQCAFKMGRLKTTTAGRVAEVSPKRSPKTIYYGKLNSGKQQRTVSFSKKKANGNNCELCSSYFVLDLDNIYSIFLSIGRNKDGQFSKRRSKSRVTLFISFVFY